MPAGNQIQEVSVGVDVEAGQGQGGLGTVPTGVWLGASGTEQCN
jgi:hypothetical protein